MQLAIKHGRAGCPLLLGNSKFYFVCSPASVGFLMGNTAKVIGRGALIDDGSGSNYSFGFGWLTAHNLIV